MHRIHRKARAEPCASASRDGSFSIILEIVGPGTNAIAACREGQGLDLLGPLGMGYDLSEVGDGTECILVAGGVGVASMHALAESLVEKRAVVTLAVGGRRMERLPLNMAEVKPRRWRDKDLADLGVRLEVITETGDVGRRGMATDLLADILAEAGTGRPHVFACGPWPMMKETARMAAERDIPCQVLLEEMMGCGIGACLSCACRTKTGIARVCVDGPAFDAGSVDWNAR